MEKLPLRDLFALSDWKVLTEKNWEIQDNQAMILEDNKKDILLTKNFQAV